MSKNSAEVKSVYFLRDSSLTIEYSSVICRTLVGGRYLTILHMCSRILNLLEWSLTIGYFTVVSQTLFMGCLTLLQMRSRYILHLRDWNLTIWYFNVISTTLLGGVLSLCRCELGVFYSSFDIVLFNYWLKEHFSIRIFSGWTYTFNYEDSLIIFSIIICWELRAIF